MISKRRSQASAALLPYSINPTKIENSLKNSKKFKLSVNMLKIRKRAYLIAKKLYEISYIFRKILTKLV